MGSEPPPPPCVVAQGPPTESGASWTSVSGNESSSSWSTGRSTVQQRNHGSPALSSWTPASFATSTAPTWRGLLGCQETPIEREAMLGSRVLGCVSSFSCRGCGGDDTFLQLVLQAGAPVGNLYMATYLGMERRPTSVREFWCFFWSPHCPVGGGKRVGWYSCDGSALKLSVCPGRRVLLQEDCQLELFMNKNYFCDFL